MTGDESAFPRVESESDVLYGEGQDRPTTVVSSVSSAGGLTKRELFAAMAMQGLASRESYRLVSLPEAGGLAAQLADALIAALERKAEGA